MSPETLAHTSQDLANEMAGLFFGKPTVAVLAAFGMHIGYAASLGDKPDLDGLMKLIRNGAQAEFDRRMEARKLADANSIHPLNEGE